ncbi:uncharacterized protein RHO17_000057 [Thomomys bottae]
MQLLFPGRGRRGARLPGTLSRDHELIARFRPPPEGRCEQLEAGCVGRSGTREPRLGGREGGWAAGRGRPPPALEVRASPEPRGPRPPRPPRHRGGTVLEKPFPSPF